MGELVISNVDKIYRSRKGDVHAVKAVNLTVKPGEIAAEVKCVREQGGAGEAACRTQADERARDVDRYHHRDRGDRGGNPRLANVPSPWRDRAPRPTPHPQRTG